MTEWLKEQLSTCLQFEVPDEMIEYILSLRDIHEVDEHFATLLDFEVPEHVLFLNDYKQRLLKKNGTSKNNRPLHQKNTSKVVAPLPPKTQPKSRVSSKDEPGRSDGGGGKKQKPKFVNLYTSDTVNSDVILLKGRHRCDCQASKHKLINNCVKCGRIVCDQEGSGPCLFCGTLVCSEDELRMIESATKKGDHLKRSLTEQSRPKGWEEALATRNRLLEYDRSSEKRTTIIDDESDYFKASSVWLSDSERKKLKKIEDEMREKKHGSRLNRKITLDFAGRQVITEPSISAEYEDEVLKEIASSCTPNYKNKKMIYDAPTEKDLADKIHPFHQGPIPIFDNSLDVSNNNMGTGYDGVYSKVQDKEFLEMSDMRNCMSMHQPWASLLIAGIKKHEGRTWYSSHRGRLWIASTAKPVELEDIKRMEQFYRSFYNDESIEFPSQYPSGCLLGCVLVQDCLPQEEYRKIHKDEGESESPFVFVCNEFQELPIRFPVKGEHKIYKLDAKIHQAAVKSLQRISKIQAEH